MTGKAGRREEGKKLKLGLGERKAEDPRHIKSTSQGRQEKTLSNGGERIKEAKQY